MEQLKKENTQIMLLQKTKITGEKLEEIMRKMKPRYEAVAIYAKGIAGGIAILWNPVEVKEYYWIGMQHILTGWLLAHS